MSSPLGTQGTSSESDPPIGGVRVTPLREIADARGAVLHMIRIDSPEFTTFGECYFSEILPGVIKAWKRHRAQSQNLAVPVGRIRLAIFDDAESHPQIMTLELGRPDAYRLVHIPAGVWYGFECIGPTAALLANCADRPHDPTDSESRAVHDERMPYPW